MVDHMGKHAWLEFLRKETAVFITHWKKLAAAMLGTGLVFLAAGPITWLPHDATAAVPGPGELIVHEWGTFLSVQGSDGVTLGGMVDSDEQLPPFVESRSISTWERCMMREKMETPVTYFYTDRPRDVQVQVRMPKGVLTHWFPNVCRFGPKPGAKSAVSPTDSYLDWCTLHLIPDKLPYPREEIHVATTTKGQVYSGRIVSRTADEVVLQAQDLGARLISLPTKELRELAVAKDSKGPPPPKLPDVAPEQIWRYARQTDSALVQVQTRQMEAIPGGNRIKREYQCEKFLFYRGLGTFTLPLEVRSNDGPNKAGLVLRLHNTQAQPLRGLFAVSVAKDTIQFAELTDLPAKATREVAAASVFVSPVPLEVGVPQVKSAVAKALVTAGLYPREAQAMVNTWENSYFRTAGMRMLYVLPRETVDGVIPLQIRPAPNDLVRVMVGRVEVLTPAAERRIEEAVTGLGAKDPTLRKAAQAELAGLGRLQEPVLHRIAALTTNPEVRTQAKALIEAPAARR
jgi:hypothetical protein